MDFAILRLFSDICCWMSVLTRQDINANVTESLQYSWLKHENSKRSKQDLADPRGRPERDPQAKVLLMSPHFSYFQACTSTSEECLSSSFTSCSVKKAPQWQPTNSVKGSLDAKIVLVMTAVETIYHVILTIQTLAAIIFNLYVLVSVYVAKQVMWYFLLFFCHNLKKVIRAKRKQNWRQLFLSFIL